MQLWCSGAGFFFSFFWMSPSPHTHPPPPHPPKYTCNQTIIIRNKNKHFSPTPSIHGWTQHKLAHGISSGHGGWLFEIYVYNNHSSRTSVSAKRPVAEVGSVHLPARVYSPRFWSNNPFYHGVVIDFLFITKTAWEEKQSDFEISKLPCFTTELRSTSPSASLLSSETEPVQCQYWTLKHDSFRFVTELLNRTCSVSILNS